MCRRGIVESLLLLFLLVVAVSVRPASSDIVGTNPPVDSCLCPSNDNVNVRDAPCGNVTDVIGINDCHRYTGNNVVCTDDIDYQFFEVNFGDGQTGWIVGNYLILEQSGYCSEFPCGAPSPIFPDLESDGRLIGGTDSVRNMFPWQLVIEVDVDGEWQLTCGAVLIDTVWAVTAAHCVQDLAQPMRLVAGVYNRSEPIDQNQIRNVNQQHIITHPNYDESEYLNDLALISIPQPYDLSTPTIRTICLPPSSDTEYIEMPSCYITGWGVQTYGTTEAPEVLQGSGIDVIRQGNCMVLINGVQVPEDVTCVYDQVNRAVSACTGDWGGPLSCAINTRFQLAGIGSRSFEPDCDPIAPQFYVNIPYFLDWIKETTGVE